MSGENVDTSQTVWSVYRERQWDSTRVIDCNQLLETLLAEYDPNFIFGVRIFKSLDSMAVPIKCRPQPLAQALKAFINQGLVRIRKRQETAPGQDCLLHVRTKQLSKWVALEIYDNGVSFDDCQVLALFGPKARPDVGGVDKFRAHNVIEQLHGGHVFYKAQEKGHWENCVRILLPLQAG